jgi:DNA polymerase-3 subunit beta
MKISVLQENLARGMSLVSRFVANQPQLPILENVLLKAKRGRFNLAATNLSMGASLWLGAKVLEEGEITVPAKIFNELVSSMMAKRVDLEVKGDQLRVKSGSSRAAVNGIAATEFPKIETFKGGGLMKVKTKDFEKVVSRVAFAAAIDETRPVLAGVQIKSKDGVVRLAATDGYRLSVEKTKKMKLTRKFEEEMLVPARALIEVVQVIKSFKGVDEVVLGITEKEGQVVFRVGEVEVVCQLLEGEFPPFEKIIPEERKTRVRFDLEEAMQAVRVAAIFARDSANIVRFKIKGKKLVVSAEAPELGGNETRLTVKKEGEDGEIAFNSRYLLEYLSCLEKGEVELQINGSLNPGLFKKREDRGFLHVVMPVRVQK